MNICPTEPCCATEPTRSNSYRLPLSPQVTEKDFCKAGEYLQQYEQRYRQLQAQRAAELRARVDTARRRLREVIGAENYWALRLRMEELKTEARQALRPPGGLDLEFTTVNEKRIEQAAAFLRDRGVDIDQYRRTLEEVRLPMPFHSNVGVLNVGKVIADAQVPADVLDRSPEPPEWTLVRPPYEGWQQGTHFWTSSGFYWIPFLETDPQTGFVANVILLANPDAGDDDGASCTADSQLSFWYTPSSTGLIEVWVEAQCGEGVHDVRLENEWGTSASSTWHKNFLMMHVLHPQVTGPSLAQVSDSVWIDDWAGLHRQLVVPGDIHWAHLFSDGPVPAHEPVVVRVGTRSDDTSWSNDVSVRSDSNFRWFIRSVQLRTTA
jgi:hypothetical protein